MVRLAEGGGVALRSVQAGRERAAGDGMRHVRVREHMRVVERVLEFEGAGLVAHVVLAS